MNDPKTVVLDRLEVYSKLKHFQFVETQRLYFCKDLTLIDITSFHRINIPELLVCVYDDKAKAELFSYAQEYLSAGKPVLFGRIVKISNKREKHEVQCENCLLKIDDIFYNIQKTFIRAELEKQVLERVVLNY